MLVLLSLHPALLHLPVRHMHLPDGGWRPHARQIPERRSPIPYISRAPGAEAGAPMNTRATILSAVVLAAAPLAARPKVDTIVMTNGDRITGEIKGLDGGVLRVDLDYVDGTMALQWMKVARVESPQLFIVQTQDGSSYTGTLFTSPGETNKI